MNARHITGREDLQDYIDAFNRKDYEHQISYYAPDVEYKVGSIVLTSPRAIADFYADFHTYSDEFVSIGWFAMTGDKVAVTIPSWFGPFRDYKQNGLDFTAGQERRQVSFGWYHLKEGQIHRIRVARYVGPEDDFAVGA